MIKCLFLFFDALKVPKQMQKPIFVVKATFLENDLKNWHNEMIEKWSKDH